MTEVGRVNLRAVEQWGEEKNLIYYMRDFLN
jgi:hypothetical protein